MEKFMIEYKKIKLYDDDDIFDEINELKQHFFVDKDINKLEFIGFVEDVGFFKYKNEFMFCELNDYTWGKLEKEYLDTNNPISETTCLMKDSSNKISYVLKKIDDTFYPIIDDMVNFNILTVIEPNWDDIDKKSVKWVDNIEIKIEDNKYILMKNNEFFSGFEDVENCFQPGDAFITVYTNKCNNKLIIKNIGDVSSIIEIMYIQ